MEIMYVDRRPRTESETMMLNTRVEPSWIKHKTLQTTEVV